MQPSNSRRFPYHLAKLVAKRLPDFKVVPPSDQILLRLFETLYFASLRTDEARPCRCTINYVDPLAHDAESSSWEHTTGWMVVPLEDRLPLTVRALVKLADAVDPTVSSLAVCHDGNGDLYIWGMVDQEIRYGDYVALAAKEDPKRAGAFQATITGVGSVSAYKDFALLGSLEQDNLVADYHDVLWEGPVFGRLRENLDANLQRALVKNSRVAMRDHVEHVKDELLVRWQNAICRILFNIQQYGHGGGLLIAPPCPSNDLNVKYKIVYDRLPRELFRLSQHHILGRQTAATIDAHCSSVDTMVPCDKHFDLVQSQKALERQKRELLGCIRFIAALSRVDGFVLLDRSLVVQGFGVEARADADLVEVDVAGDANGTVSLLRKLPLSSFGTRHRAMLRYCDEHEGTIGFVISQDGDIRATMKHEGRLVLWENINVQLAYRPENRGTLIENFSPKLMMALFGSWMNSSLKANAA